jgi:glutaredoxin
MEITIYSTPTCSQCKMLKRKLQEKDINFFDICDEEQTLKIAEKTGIMSAPIVEIDGICYNKQKAEEIIFKG